VIVEQDDVELAAFLYGGDYFLRHHQVRAVADQELDFAIGMRQLHAEATRDFVAHARVAVLHVIAPGLAGAPEFVQVSGQAACGAEHDVGRLGEVVDDTDDFSLRDRRIFTETVDAIDFFFQFARKSAILSL